MTTTITATQQAQAARLAVTFVRNINIHDEAQLGSKKYDNAEAVANRAFDKADAKGEEFYAVFHAEVERLRYGR